MSYLPALKVPLPYNLFCIYTTAKVSCQLQTFSYETANYFWCWLSFKPSGSCSIIGNNHTWTVSWSAYGMKPVTSVHSHPSKKLTHSWFTAHLELLSLWQFSKDVQTCHMRNSKGANTAERTQLKSEIHCADTRLIQLTWRKICNSNP